jgi:hypothetical protein
MGKIISLVIAVLLLLATGAFAVEPYCFDEAGAQYGINPQILRAIAKVESNNNPRAINWNRNGSYDFGVMQINSIWASTLGPERWSALGDVCTNIKTGAMILAACMEKYGYTWEAVGCYNSQTPVYRNRYAQLVSKQLQRIQRDEKQGRAGVDAAVRSKIDALSKASQAGSDRNPNPDSGVPLTFEVVPEQPALPVEGSVQFDARGGELSASSATEGNPTGM